MSWCCTPPQPLLLQVLLPLPSSLRHVLYLRLPLSSIVVCTQKNPNKDGLIRTQKGGGGVRTHCKGQTLGVDAGESEVPRQT